MNKPETRIKLAAIVSLCMMLLIIFMLSVIGMQKRIDDTQLINALVKSYVTKDKEVLCNYASMGRVQCIVLDPKERSYDSKYICNTSTKQCTHEFLKTPIPY